jgi:hypothetical protein
MTLRREAVFTFAGVLAGGPVLAKGQGQGHGGGAGGPHGQGGGHGGPHGHGPGQGQGQGHEGGRPGLGQREFGLIQSWQGANPGWTPPNLPPGQLRRLQQGKPLPPGIARQALPPGLLANLPAYPGHAYYAVGPDVVLIAAATGAVVNLLAGVLAQ